MISFKNHNPDQFSTFLDYLAAEIFKVYHKKKKNQENTLEGKKIDIQGCKKEISEFLVLPKEVEVGGQQNNKDEEKSLVTRVTRLTLLGK